MMRRLVIFDIDGTLLERPNSETAFIFYLLRRGQLGLRQLLSAAWFFLRWTRRYGRRVGKKNKAYLNGLEVAEVEQHARDFVREKLLPNVRHNVAQRLQHHRQAGDLVVLLSGTPEFIAAPLAQGLGAQAWSATRCTTRNGVFTAKPPQAHPFGREKLQRAAELSHKHGASLTTAYAYADAKYDLPLLCYVSQPVAVFPDTELEQFALKQGWEIISTGKDSEFDTAVGA